MSDFLFDLGCVLLAILIGIPLVILTVIVFPFLLLKLVTGKEYDFEYLIKDVVSVWQYIFENY